MYDIEVSTNLDVPKVCLRWAWPISVMYYRSNVDGWYVLKVYGNLPHAGDGTELGWFGSESRFQAPIQTDRFGEEVRAAIMTHLGHELDESLTVNGVHVREPHPVQA